MIRAWMRLGALAIAILATTGAVLSEESAPPAEKAPAKSGPCLGEGCHADFLKAKFTHGPTAVGSCESCHGEEKPDHKFPVTRKEPDLCYVCHLRVDDEKYVHDPVRKGSCTLCHDPHKGENKYLLKAGDTSKLCSSCHTDVVGGEKFVHGPVAAGACTACHDAHQSDNARLLYKEGMALCSDCHKEIEEELAQRKFPHKPSTESCQSCHTSHASNFKGQLKEEVTGLCYKCHKETEEEIKSAVVPHGAITQGAGCLSCHTPHASDFASALKESPIDMCLSCHDREMLLADGTKLQNVKEDLATHSNLHGPIREGNCSACHTTHGGKHYRLLVKDYPQKFYSDYDPKNYELCFSCHEKALVAERNTTTLTRFRNGEANLHFLHVNQRKGRTCRACHATHASNFPSHLRESTPYGNWEIPIEFTGTESGGSCQSGCHKPKAYDRKNPVTYE